MPLYFFDYVHEGIVERDQIGVELPDDISARDEAIRAQRDYAKDYMLHDGPEADLAVMVRDDTSRHVVEVKLAYEVKTLDTNTL